MCMVELGQPNANPAIGQFFPAHHDNLNNIINLFSVLYVLAQAATKTASLKCSVEYFYAPPITLLDGCAYLILEQRERNCAFGRSFTL